MAQYDFLDPNQVNQYREKARLGGMKPTDIESYVTYQQKKQLEKAKVGLDIQDYSVKSIENSQKMSSLLGLTEEPPSQTTKDKQRFAGLAIDTVNKMENIFYRGGDSLAEGRGVGGKVRLGLEDIGESITGKSATKDRYREFEAIRSILVSQLSQSFGSGTPQEGEAERLISTMPGRNSSDQEAQAWFDNVRELLANAAGKKLGASAPGLGVEPQSMMAPGLDIESPPTSPAINIKGEIAQPGDLIKDDTTGELSLYGSPDDKGSVFKRTQYGGSVDNALIKFLADSEFLPIAGSIVGGILGVGLASVGTSAAGATAGKIMQQGLRELVDPERQDMSDIASAVLIEGMTDAIIGGALFGVGAVAGKGMKLVFGEGAQQAAKEGSEEAATALSKRKTRAAHLVNTALNPTQQSADKYFQNTGRIFGEDVVRKGIPETAEEAYSMGSAGLKVARQQKSALLESAGNINPNNALEVLDSAIKEYSENPELSEVVRKLQGQAERILKVDGDVPATLLDDIKRTLQKAGKAAYNPSGDPSLVSDKLADVATRFRSYLEEIKPELVGTNQEIMYYKLLKVSGLKQMTKPKAKAFIDFADFILLGTNPAVFLSKAGISAFVKTISDPLQQAKLLSEGLQMSAATGNRQGVRNSLRLINKLGGTFSATGRGVRGAVAGAGASAITSQVEPAPLSPGLDIEQPSGNPGFDLGAMSQEGVPLYR